MLADYIIIFYLCFFLADFSVAVPIPTKAPGTDMGCPKGWGRYKGFCYFANLAILEFAEAEKACKNQGAEMASILDMNANNFLRANIYEKSKYFKKVVLQTKVEF